MTLSKIFSRLFRVIRQRPARFLSIVRTYLMFWCTHLFWRVLGPANVYLGKNVRVQRLRCLMADAPNASVEVGDHSIIYEDAIVEAYGNAKVTVGECSILGPTRIYSRYGVKIGKRFLSSWNVFIQDFDPHPVDPQLRCKQVMSIVSSHGPIFGERLKAEHYSSDFRGESITIGDDVWVGANATIFRGAHIGDGSIVAAGAVVLKGEYPARAVLGGNPAKVVRIIPAVDREAAPVPNSIT